MKIIWTPGVGLSLLGASLFMFITLIFKDPHFLKCLANHSQFLYESAV